MCGIVGIVGRSPVNQALYDALLVLQHRGQDAAGIVTCDLEGHLHLRKDNGLVRDVFHEQHMRNLTGPMGIGHVRYPTAGSASSAEAQPFYVNSPYGITLGHNGNLTNASDLKRELFLEDRRHINTESDSEILLNVLAQELIRQDGLAVTQEEIFNAVSGVHRRCQGAYAVVAMVAGRGVVGFRDPHGIRPVVFGRRETPEGPEYMVASESVALDTLGFELVRDLDPGEAVYIEMDGTVHTRHCAEQATLSPCIFEYVYFARPDSVIDDVVVHRARMRMGTRLGKKILREWPDHDIDVIIPIPDTGRTVAIEMAHELNVKYREGFIKNRYIGRTFIMPGQTQRRKSVRQKLNAIGLEFKGKNVLLVDDSIVRGTTSREIVMMARESGARKVYFASAAPPVRYPNVYGIDMPAAQELIAHGRSEDEVCQAVAADRLIYQDLEDLVGAVRKGNPRLEDFDCSVFTGEYVTQVSRDYLAHLEERRNDLAKKKKEREYANLDLYNNA
ncbi:MULTISPECIES: amidophosphoribosyltransferase [Ectothiorhodospira]|uniref:amidophosphoribosyltransferase n=1 Tax=Ectothiorhodospira TaxID=1051 RepID=UPI001EE8E282|nr:MULTISPECIES: amidophosphoribosyltransferase [Ectothiorhodospira]MCG5495316.1 amidophosphoribosyltransferase [Ectothiorhodospira variabilis]MCG5497443.1 amidophosphoribosyltransferase [Ectothiorhodospira variabilis]MCG5504914.1 amidophosphoribosyltransferase [Ectothiorhodospira variabilis]MCG5508071.1 amidophosphoribosyltransferase [Ectothiorhodospira variabilis]MCG5524134.1 amidophosphoribosyltransferase [Ectothiorhodospira haloalkaliphila]